jgi:hypothetical protein
MSQWMAKLRSYNHFGDLLERDVQKERKLIKTKNTIIGALCTISILQGPLFLE